MTDGVTDKHRLDRRYEDVLLQYQVWSRKKKKSMHNIYVFIYLICNIYCIYLIGILYIYIYCIYM